jgi:hypothetical protein
MQEKRWQLLRNLRPKAWKNVINLLQRGITRFFPHMHAYTQTTIIGAGEKVAAPLKPETKSVEKCDKSLAEGN